MFKRIIEKLKAGTKADSSTKVEDNSVRQTIAKPLVVGSKPVEHRTFTETGEFIMATEFEKIWIDKNKNDNYNAADSLNDDEYLDYKLWDDMNTEAMYKKHLPNTLLFRGKNPNIIFHGGCLGCMSQRLHGLERCKGCMYFRFNGCNTNLYIKGEESAKMSGDDLKRLLGGE